MRRDSDEDDRRGDEQTHTETANAQGHEGTLLTRGRERRACIVSRRGNAGQEFWTGRSAAKLSGGVEDTDLPPVLWACSNRHRMRIGIVRTADELFQHRVDRASFTTNSMGHF